MSKKHRTNLAAWNKYRDMADCPAAKAFAAEHGADAQITGWGMTYAEITAKVAALYELI